MPPPETEGTPLPMVSVVMPIRNEGGFLQQSLGAVLAQDYPPDRVEILIADGMSVDETVEIVRQLQRDHANLYLVPNPAGIVAAGLNAALRQAKGEVIVRVDGHTVIAPDYVRQCVAALGRTGAANVGGRMTAVGRGPFGRAVAAATSSPFGVGDSRFHYSDREEWVDSVYMGAWRREWFDRAGLFDEELVRNQDDEFNYRTRALGGRILLSPLIASRYTNRSSPGRLWKQYFEYGYWKVRVMQRHGRQMRPRHFAPAAFVLALLLGLVASPWAPVARWAVAGLAAAYGAASLIASLRLAHVHGLALLPVLPVTFLLIHTAYGTGFLGGLLAFGDRWGTSAIAAGAEVRSDEPAEPASNRKVGPS